LAQASPSSASVSAPRPVFSSQHIAAIAFVVVWPALTILLALTVFSILVVKFVAERRGKSPPKVPIIDTIKPAIAPAAQPQIVCSDGASLEVWPSHWGLTLEQCREFLAECQKDSGWDPGLSLYDLVERYVKPRTSGTGLGLALLRNREQPLEVNVMVSHAWGENASEFIRALELTVSQKDVLFICAFSLYQCEDGEGPSIAEQLGSEPTESPFYRVLRHIDARGQRYGLLWRWREYLWMLPACCLVLASNLLFGPIIVGGCIPTLGSKWEPMCSHSSPDKEGSELTMGAFKGYWYTNDPDDQVSLMVLSLKSSVICGVCAALIKYAVHAAAIYPGRMVVVPNRECDIYSRLWCVYEIFVARMLAVPVVLAHTLAHAGTSSSRRAVCGNEHDMLRIRGDIEEYGQWLCGDRDRGYDLVDRSILKATKSTRYTLLVPSILQFWPVMLVQVSLVRICIIVPRSKALVWGFMAIVCFSLATFVILSALYWLSKRRQGLLSQGEVCAAAFVFSLCGLVQGSFVLSLSDDIQDDRLDFVLPWLLVGTTCIISGVSLLALTVADCAVPSADSQRLHLATALSYMSWYGQFGILLFAAFGASRIENAPSIGFYCVLILSIFGYPATFLSVAHAWGIRFARPLLAEVQEQRPGRCGDAVATSTDSGSPSALGGVAVSPGLKPDPAASACTS